MSQGNTNQIYYSEPVKFHKKTTQMQMHIKKPSVKNDKIERGALFFEIAKAKEGTENMDWDNKITMKIGVSDIGKIMAGIKNIANEGIKIYHESNNGSTTLNINSGQRPGTFSFQYGKKVAEKADNIQIYLNAEDMNIFMTLITAGLPVILGWN